MDCTDKPAGARVALWPGLIVAAAIAALATGIVAVHQQLPEAFRNLPVSVILIAILIGLAMAGSAARRPHWTPGLELARGRILKIAVALIGLKLSLSDLGQLGSQALSLVVLIVIAGLVITAGLTRLVGTHWRLATLLAVGTAICGASAIAATAPGLKATSAEICYAVACIALLGLIATLAYPLLLVQWFDQPEIIGMVLGASIHDTAQVTAAAAFHEQAWQADGTLAAATVTKLMRNLTMLAVIPALIWWAGRTEPGGAGRIPLPLFIVGFVALSALRTAGDAWFGADAAAWQAGLAIAADISLFGFAMAMAALALSIRPSELRGPGWKPAAAALLAAGLMLLLALGWGVVAG
jgi:uncharacterized integral membrane protein (TIGR00698 family)